MVPSSEGSLSLYLIQAAGAEHSGHVQGTLELSITNFPPIETSHSSASVEHFRRENTTAWQLLGVRIVRVFLRRRSERGRHGVDPGRPGGPAHAQPDLCPAPQQLPPIGYIQRILQPRCPTTISAGREDGEASPPLRGDSECDRYPHDRHGRTRCLGHQRRQASAQATRYSVTPLILVQLVLGGDPCAHESCVLPQVSDLRVPRTVTVV